MRATTGEVGQNSDAVRAELARLGGHVKALRLTAGWTQIQLADRSGINRSVISQIEHGTYELGVGKLPALARSVGVQVTELFDRC